MALSGDIDQPFDVNIKLNSALEVGAIEVVTFSCENTHLVLSIDEMTFNSDTWNTNQPLGVLYPRIGSSCGASLPIEISYSIQSNWVTAPRTGSFFVTINDPCCVNNTWCGTELSSIYGTTDIFVGSLVAYHTSVGAGDGLLQVTFAAPFSTKVRVTTPAGVTTLVTGATFVQINCSSQAGVWKIRPVIDVGFYEASYLDPGPFASVPVTITLSSSSPDSVAHVFRPAVIYKAYVQVYGASVLIDESYTRDCFIVEDDVHTYEYIAFGTPASPVNIGVCPLSTPSCSSTGTITLCHPAGGVSTSSWSIPYTLKGIAAGSFVVALGVKWNPS